MKVLFYFLFRAETAAYLRWRWRHEGWHSLRVAREWVVTLLTMRRRKTARIPLTTEALSTVSDEPKDPSFSHYFLRPEQVPSLTAAIQKRFPKEVQDVLDKAEQMMGAGLISLPTGTILDLRRYSWRPPVHDAEHFLALHRWSYGTVLAKAWAYSGQPRFEEYFRNLLTSWGRATPPNEGDPAWESYSVSERMVHWCFCTLIFWNAPAFRELTYPLVEEQLRKHAAWLEAHLEKDLPHNHLIANARALYTVGLFLDDTKLRSLGWRLLQEGLERQVFPDGFLREQSVPYHLLLTRTFIEAEVLATLAAENVPQAFTDRVRKMIDASAAFLRPDGSCPLIGDVSPDIELEALAGTIAAGQIRFGLPQNVPLSEHGAWLAGDIPKSEAQPEARSLFLPEAGYMVHRAKDLHVVFHSDPRAEVVRHGHADALGICLWQGGREILRDSGNVSYNFDRWWNYFHGPQGHSAISVAGLPCYPLTNFLAPLFTDRYRQAETGLERPRASGEWTCASGWHSGYSRLGARLIIRRRLIVGPEYLWATDWIEGPSSNDFESRWQWGHDKAESAGAPGRWTLTSEGKSSVSVLWLLDERPANAEWEDGWHSPAYGRKEKSLTARVSGHHTRLTRLDLITGWGKATPQQLRIVETGHEQIVSPEWKDDFHVDSEGHRFEAARARV